MYDTPEQASEAWAHFFKLGTTNLMAGKLDEAEKDLKVAVSIADKNFKKDPRSAQSLSALALAYFKKNDFDFAELTYTKALEIANEVFKADDQQMLAYLNGLALCLLTNKKYVRAEPLYKRSLGLAELTRGPSTVEVAATLRNLGLIYEKLQRFDEARAVYSRLANVYDETKLADSSTIRLKLSQLPIPSKHAPTPKPLPPQINILDSQMMDIELPSISRADETGAQNTLEQKSSRPGGMAVERKPEKTGAGDGKKNIWSAVKDLMAPGEQPAGEPARASSGAGKQQPAPTKATPIKPAAAAPPTPNRDYKPPTAKPTYGGGMATAPTSNPGTPAGKSGQPATSSLGPPGDTIPVDTKAVDTRAVNTKAVTPTASATPSAAATTRPPSSTIPPAATTKTAATPTPPLSGTVISSPAGADSRNAPNARTAQPQSSNSRSKGMSTPQGIAEHEREKLIGTTIDNRYRIDAYVGAGGMSVVYKATHLMMDRVVAIKMMHSHLAEQQEVFQRFQQEAKAASSLAHPNIAPAHDFGIASDGVLYLVMDYVEGQTLDEMVKAMGHIPLQRTVDILKQSCNGLHYAHETGLLHRDIKPSNIMVIQSSGKPDLVKIVDFGLAKSITADSEAMKLTRTGEFVGSPLYMSPEQFRAQPLDRRSDIYSLGLVAYECLTGKRAITGETYGEVVVQHFSEAPLSFSEASPNISLPKSLEKAVFKALEKEPADRFTSVEEFSQALSAAIKAP